MAAYEELCRLTPAGAHTLSKDPRRFPLGAYPPFLERGQGVWVYDADGNRFIDLICSLGASTLGYGQTWGTTSASFSLPNRQQLDASRFITSTFRAEAVRFLTTGSDACSYAVRAARAYTGRDTVLVADNGYHGTHDWFTVLRDEHPGVPDELIDHADRFPYNDLSRLEYLLSTGWTMYGRPTVALVMLEPCLFTEPKDGFLQGVVDLAHQHGALVCFDETILGGRMHLLGGSGYFDVWPDLRVYGKALAAGEACAFVVGPLDVLEAGRGYSGTFLGNGTGLAGLMYGVNRYLGEPLIANQWAHGQRIQDTLRRALDGCELDGVVDGYPWHPRLTFKGTTELLQMSVFLQEAADRDVLWHEAGVNIPATLNEQEISHVCQGLRGAIEAVAEGVPLRGQLIQRGMQIRRAA